MDEKRCFQDLSKLLQHPSRRPFALDGQPRYLESEKELNVGSMTLEMGKTLGSAIAEAEKCALAATTPNTLEFIADEVIATTASKSFIRYQPLGIVLAVMPGTFLSGNVSVLLRPA